jgi:hypothetical protein
MELARARRAAHQAAAAAELKVVGSADLTLAAVMAGREPPNSSRWQQQATAQQQQHAEEVLRLHERISTAEQHARRLSSRNVECTHAFHRLSLVVPLKRTPRVCVTFHLPGEREALKERGGACGRLPTVEAQREAATAVATAAAAEGATAAQLQLATELAGARVDVAAAMEAAAEATAAAAAEARSALADAADMAKQLRTVLPELSLLRDRLTHAGE